MNASHKISFSCICLEFVGGFLCVWFEGVWGLGLFFHNKAMEYLLLSLFAEGNNPNGENKACCTRLVPLKD